jgi:hypothetical protein
MSGDTIQPFDVQEEWVPVPPHFTADTLALTYLWGGLDETVINNHDDNRPHSRVLEPLILGIRNLEGQVLERLGQTYETKPTFRRVPWRSGEINPELVYSGLQSLGERYSCPCIILTDTREVTEGDFEEVNFAFVRTEAGGWQPFATNPHGLMAVVVAHYSSYELYTPVSVTLEPLKRLRNA